MTAYPTDEYQSRALKDRATSFLKKPLDERVLVGCLSHAIVGPDILTTPLDFARFDSRSDV